MQKRSIAHSCRSNQQLLSMLSNNPANHSETSPSWLVPGKMSARQLPASSSRCMCRPFGLMTSVAWYMSVCASSCPTWCSVPPENTDSSSCTERGRFCSCSSCLSTSSMVLAASSSARHSTGPYSIEMQTMQVSHNGFAVQLPHSMQQSVWISWSGKTYMAKAGGRTTSHHAMQWCLWMCTICQPSHLSRVDDGIHHIPVYKVRVNWRIRPWQAPQCHQQRCAPAHTAAQGAPQRRPAECKALARWSVHALVELTKACIGLCCVTPEICTGAGCSTQSNLHASAVGHRGCMKAGCPHRSAGRTSVRWNCCHSGPAAAISMPCDRSSTQEVKDMSDRTDV